MAYNYMGNSYLETTTQNPIDYYWEQINKSLNSMTQKEDTKKSHIEHFKSSIARNAQRLGVDVNDRQMYADYCFKACQAVLYETVFPKGKATSTGYGLEYFICGKDIFELGKNKITINMDPNSFYNDLLNTIEDTLKSDVNKALLGSKRNSCYTVLNMDKLRTDLAQKVHSYYAEYPEKTTSTESNPDLQGVVSRVFSKVSRDFTKKITESKHSSTWSL